jgi:hypothetical protein
MISPVLGVFLSALRRLASLSAAHPYNVDRVVLYHPSSTMNDKKFVTNVMAKSL